MLPLTHAVLGCLSVFIIVKLAGASLDVEIFVATALGSFLPDDELLGSVVYMHSLLIALLVSSILLIFVPLLLVSFFFLGYLIHLIVDSLTIVGVEWFYPISNFTLSFKFRPNSTYELMFLFLVSILMLFYITSVGGGI